MQAWCSLWSWQRCRRHLCRKYHTGAFNRCFKQTVILFFFLALGKKEIKTGVVDSMFIAKLNFKAFQIV